MATDDPHPLDGTAMLGSLQSLLLSAPHVDEFLGALAALAAQAVEPRVSCGITTRHNGRPLTVAVSDDRAGVIDEQQYGAGEGPCLEAMDTGRVVDVPDQVEDRRWSTYGKAAAARGVRSSLSLPLIVKGEPMGALNLYSFGRPNAFTSQEVQRAQVFAADASTALTLSLQYTEQREMVEHLEQALVSRSVIDQAIGVLMAEQRCDADMAFNLLRSHSQNTNRKLREVAAGVIERFTGHQAKEPGTFRKRASEENV